MGTAELPSGFFVACTVASPPSLGGCDWVCGLCPQVVSDLSEEGQRSWASTRAQGLPQHGDHA